MERNRQAQTPLFDAMVAYHRRNVVPFDVPGHKHGAGLPEYREYFGNAMMELDVNSMRCLDNLCNPISVIKDAEDLAAEAYGADGAFFLVNGTTIGVQTMILAAVKPGEKIILPRNAHKSAVMSLILSGARPVYIQPEIDENLGIAMGVSLEAVARAIEQNPDARAVFLVNPTYYGAASDIKTISAMAHARNMLVLVDEAHGAHMRFHPDLPGCAMSQGADLCAVSLHKTGGSLTQSSILLMREERITYKEVKTAINLMQTTSASYLLMGSLDVARKQLALEGEVILERVIKLCRGARERLNKIEGVYAFGNELTGNPGVYAFDETKLGINVRGLGLSGFEAYDILIDEYNIQMELGDMYNVLAIVSVGDTEESIGTLCAAIEDMAVKHRLPKALDLKTNVLYNPSLIMTPREAHYSPKHILALEDAVGEISGEAIMTYPPGIPLITPGEKFSAEMVEYIQWLKEEDSQLQGAEDPEVNFVKVVGV